MEALVYITIAMTFIAFALNFLLAYQENLAIIESIENTPLNEVKTHGLPFVKWFRFSIMMVMMSTLLFNVMPWMTALLLNVAILVGVHLITRRYSYIAGFFQNYVAAKHARWSYRIAFGLGVFLLFF